MISDEVKTHMWNDNELKLRTQREKRRDKERIYQYEFKFNKQMSVAQMNYELTRHSKLWVYLYSSLALLRSECVSKWSLFLTSSFTPS